jgi:hypothetical protein
MDIDAEYSSDPTLEDSPIPNTPKKCNSPTTGICKAHREPYLSNNY